MPSNTLVLGLYERCILKRTFRHTTGFCRFREGERRRLSIGDNFLQQLRRSGVSRVCGEKVAAARTEKLGTHTLTHTHTGRLLYPRYSPAAARVISHSCLSSQSVICLYIHIRIINGRKINTISTMTTQWYTNLIEMCEQ